MKIGVVAPGSPVEPATAERVKTLATALYGQSAPEIVFHPQCFNRWGHFAGHDAARTQAVLDIANDPSFDALWFGRGGYGACRLTADLLPRLTAAARDKLYLGYSDAGMLLAALYNKGFAQIAHGPMPTDITREGGEAAVARALGFVLERRPETLEPSVAEGAPVAAFNLTILSHLLGTPFQPDLSGHVLMLEEVGEHMYRIDRAFFHLTSNPAIRKVAGLKLGRCSDILPNNQDFGQTEEEIARHWCQVSGIAYLGRADIGHDIGNKIVPFGRFPWR